MIKGSCFITLSVCFYKPHRTNTSILSLLDKTTYITHTRFPWNERRYLADRGISPPLHVHTISICISILFVMLINTRTFTTELGLDTTTKGTEFTLDGSGTWTRVNGTSTWRAFSWLDIVVGTDWSIAWFDVYIVRYLFTRFVSPPLLLEFGKNRYEVHRVRTHISLRLQEDIKQWKEMRRNLP